MKTKKEAPEKISSGASSFEAWLGDGLETAVLEAYGVGGIEWHRVTDDLGDEGVTVACNPDVAGLIDRDGTAGIEVAGGRLDSCARRRHKNSPVTDDGEVVE
jgi:hypothetical protein